MPQTFEGSGAGVVSQPQTFVGVPLLTGFKVDYKSSDHHVLALAVSPLYDTVGEGPDLRNTVTTKYFDNFVPDDYGFVASFQDETRPGVIVRHVDGGSRGGAFTFPLNFPAANHTFALIGFDFRFDQVQESIGFFFRPTYKDHHIGTVSIRADASQENLTVQFSDQNNDDAYVWQVWYAWLPNDIVNSIETISGSGDRGSATRELTPGGVAVVRGFTLTYGSLENRRGNDHHADEIGVLLEEPVTPELPAILRVFFNDRNDDDRFAWAVDVARLRSPVSDPGVIL
ncbi:MAG TPA: hypothetical protein VH740_12585 [Vicinamibacterales bacterium]|jgi:hypothetical protein